LELPLDGSAARKSDSEALAALQTAVVHDCALAARGMASSSKREKSEQVYFM
jgi:hypothetical protein